MGNEENAGNQHFILFPTMISMLIENLWIFVKLACSEQDIVVTIIVRCMCVHLSIRIRISNFVQAITFTIVDAFQNNFTQLFSITCRCVI